VIDQHNQGQNAAANLAISLANAPLIARMDADDVCDPGRLAKQVAFMKDNPDVGLVGTQIRRLGDRRSGLRSSFPIDHVGIVDALLQNHHAI
jgi:glycosyltransferase involved in cell wall biosynthesis